MDKETLSKYGWVVIVIIVLVILMGLASPFAEYVKNSATSALHSFTSIMTSTENNFLNIDADGLNEEYFASPTTHYTIEQINADATMYGIGETKPEYVVADFNDDYTEVVITKNGDESDGKISTAGAMSSVYVRVMKPHISTLESAVFKTGIVNVPTHMFNNPYTSNYIDCPNLTSIKFAKTIVNIAENALSNNVLEKIEIPESVKNIGKNAFANSKNLAYVTFSGVETIGESAFSGCIALKEIILPESLISLGQSSFRGCTSLTKVICNSKNLTAAGNFSYPAFYQCTSLSDFSFGENITRIPSYICKGLPINTVDISSNITIIGEAAFNGSSIQSFNFDNIQKIEASAFANSNIGDLFIPGNVKEIGKSAFYGCNNIKNIVIEEGLTTLGESAFEAWYIRNITVPDSLISIGEYAMGYCVNGGHCLSQGYGHFKGIKCSTNSYVRQWATERGVLIAS